MLTIPHGMIFILQSIRYEWLWGSSHPVGLHRQAKSAADSCPIPAAARPKIRFSRVVRLNTMNARHGDIEMCILLGAEHASGS
jgi:hypothetical protein